MSNRTSSTDMSSDARTCQKKFFKLIAILNAEGPELRQCEIAARAGISPSLYSDLRNLKKSMSLRVAESIANVFDMAITIELLTDEADA